MLSSRTSSFAPFKHARHQNNSRVSNTDAYNASTVHTYYHRPRWLVSPDASTLTSPVFPMDPDDGHSACHIASGTQVSILSNRSNMMHGKTTRTRQAADACIAPTCNGPFTHADTVPRSFNDTFGHATRYLAMFDDTVESTIAPQTWVMDEREKYVPAALHSRAPLYYQPASNHTNGYIEPVIYPSPLTNWQTDVTMLSVSHTRSSKQYVGTQHPLDLVAMKNTAVGSFRSSGSATSMNSAVGSFRSSASQKPIGSKSCNLEGVVWWIAEWLYSIVNETSSEHAARSFGYLSPPDICMLVATRIYPILKAVSHSEQVAILAMWYIIRLTQAEQSGLTFIDHLVHAGAHTLDEIMFRTFVTGAMLSDKYFNDNSFLAKTWKKLTSLSLAYLNEAEFFALRKLNWHTQVSASEWSEWLQDVRRYLPVSARHEVADSSRRSASQDVDQVLRRLERAAIAHGCNISPTLCTIPPPQKDLPQPANWSPEADPVYCKPRRTVGIAPGVSTFAKAVTALDLLEAIVSQSSSTSNNSFGYSLTGMSQYAPASSHVSIWINSQG